MLIVISLVFIFFGFEIIIKPENYVSIIYPNNNFVRFTGYSIVFIFLILLISYTIKLIFTKRFGINIDEHGVFVNIYIFDSSRSFVEWSNIKSIERLDYYGQNFVVIYLKDNELFFKRIKNSVSLLIYKNRCRKFGSPIIVTSKSLKIKDNLKLEQLLQECFNEYKLVKKND